MRVIKVEKCFIDEILFKTQLSNCFREISLSLRVHKLLVMTIKIVAMTKQKHWKLIGYFFNFLRYS